MRKRMCGVLTGLLLAAALTACGSGGSGEKESPAEETVFAETADEMTDVSETEAVSGEEEEGDAGDGQQDEAEMAQSQMQKRNGAADWAAAFCGRQGKEVVSMCSEKGKQSLLENDLLMDEEGDGFGWSSPWPWDDAADYSIIEETDDTAVILYYARVSDPHVTVWRETLTYHTEGTGIVVDGEELKILDHICIGEEYEKAYPNGINNTPMDYAANGAGQALNDNAKEQRGSEWYGKLFEPETAAACLLNLLDNPNKVKIVSLDELREDGMTVRILFEEDRSMFEVLMIKPFGGDGIWIPQDYVPGSGPVVTEEEE